MSINQYLFSRDTFFQILTLICFKIDFTNCNHKKSKHDLG